MKGTGQPDSSSHHWNPPPPWRTRRSRKHGLHPARASCASGEPRCCWMVWLYGEGLRSAGAFRAPWPSCDPPHPSPSRAPPPCTRQTTSRRICTARAGGAAVRTTESRPGTRREGGGRWTVLCSLLSGAHSVGTRGLSSRTTEGLTMHWEASAGSRSMYIWPFV